MKKYLILDAMFEGSRTLPGAISAAYLMSKGVGLGEIASLKMIQSCVGFIGELPTGVVADHVGRRLSLLIACLLGVSSFAVYSISESFLLFVFAEVLLALCLCFWSGAFEAYALDSEKDISESEVHKFFHSNSAFNSAGTILAGVLGASIASISGFLPFAICAVMMFVLFVALLLIFPNDNRHKTIRIEHLLRAAGNTVSTETIQGLFSRSFLKYYAILAVAQFVAQPVFYYWQPWFSTWTVGPDQWKLGVIFTGIQGALLLAGIIGRSLSGIATLPPSRVQFISWAIFGISMVFMSFSKTLFSGVLFLLLAEIGLGIGLAGAKGNLNKIMNKDNRASILGAASLVGRLSGFLALGMMAVVSNWIPSQRVSLQTIFFSSGFISIVVLCLIQLKALRLFVNKFKGRDYVSANN